MEGDAADMFCVLGCLSVPCMTVVGRGRGRGQALRAQKNGPPDVPSVSTINNPVQEIQLSLMCAGQGLLRSSGLPVLCHAAVPVAQLWLRKRCQTVWSRGADVARKRVLIGSEDEGTG